MCIAKDISTMLFINKYCEQPWLIKHQRSYLYHRQRTNEYKWRNRTKRQEFDEKCLVQKAQEIFHQIFHISNIPPERQFYQHRIDKISHSYIVIRIFWGMTVVETSREPSLRDSSAQSLRTAMNLYSDYTIFFYLIHADSDHIFFLSWKCFLDIANESIKITVPHGQTNITV